MAQIKEEKKRKRKKISSHRVFGIETNFNSPRNSTHKTRNVENIGGGFNVSPTLTKRSTLKLGNANLGIDQ